MAKERMKWPDIVKAFAMICIIIGHTGVPVLQYLVHPFHVPVFFIINGYFFSSKSDIKESIKNYWKRMVIPYMLACIFLMVFNILKNFVEYYRGNEVINTVNIFIGWVGAFLFGRTSSSTVLGYDIYSVGASWFLPCLFVAMIIYRFIVNLKHRDIISFGIAIVGVIISNFINLPWHIEVSFVAVLFLNVGKTFAQKRIAEKISYPFFIAGILLYCGSVAVNFIMESCVDYASSSYHLFIFDWITAIGTSYVIIFVFKWLENLSVMKAVSVYGAHTMSVLIYHTIESSLINWRIFFKLGYYVGGALAVFLKIAGSVLVVYLVIKINTARHSGKVNPN